MTGIHSTEEPNSMLDGTDSPLDSQAETSFSETPQPILAELDKDKLQQHIQTLEQKLARQKAKASNFSPEQQQQLLELLGKQAESESATRQLRGLVERAIELNQQSEQIQQEIQGLNIVSENATNKCYEITYGAQHVIAQNEKVQKNLNEQLDRAAKLNEECESLASKLNSDLEESYLARQKMDSATDRSHSIYQKSRALLDDVTACRTEISEQANIIHQLTEVSKQTNTESLNLHKSLDVLKQQVQEKLDQQNQQMEVSNQVLAKCKQLVNEISLGKQETDTVLETVVEHNNESKETLVKMIALIQESIEKQKENRALNLNLQNSLHRNQQQREELTVLTSECREIRDLSMETQKRNESNIKESLERLSVSIAETKQNQMQAENILKEVFENNCESKQLIQHMIELKDSADTIQEENATLNASLKETLAQSNATKDELIGLAGDCRVVRDKSKALLETSMEVHNNSQTSIARLNEYMDSMCETKDELKDLISTAKLSNAETSDSLDSMRANINNSSLIQKECIRLNKESVSTTLEAKKITEKLTEELESSFKLNKHYQDRMKTAEKKYLSAIEAEKKYQELHETTLRTLRENEALLTEANATIKEYGDNTAEYSSAIKQFQQTTVQSQQIILETQASIKSLISSNDQLSEENRYLKAQLQNRQPATSANVWASLD